MADRPGMCVAAGAVPGGSARARWGREFVLRFSRLRGNWPALDMKEITIVVENRPGVVAEISELLARKGINIESITVDTAGNIGIIILMVDRCDLAMALLRDAGYEALANDALVVQLRDEPGALAEVSRRLRDAGINIRSIRVIRRGEGDSLVAISTNRQEESAELVREWLA